MAEIAKVYIAGRFIYRSLRSDADGLHIKYNNQRVNIRLDPHTKLYYIATKPCKQRTELITLQQEYKRLVALASDRVATNQAQMIEVRKQLSALRKKMKLASSL